ncbi:MAG: metallophosphoesterase [Bacteroidetes bacterium]|nr:MAG: metallophosphoesterase [Bacteroidota bacterium]
MRIVCLSDTHNLHRQIPVPEGDLLLHAGDFTQRGEEDQTRDFLDWFAGQPHPHKVFIAGNHDFIAEEQPALFRSLIPEGVHYLENESIKVAGLQLWGSPVTPWFFDWAFNKQRGTEIGEYWAGIPAGLDILITHGPPYGIRDLNHEGKIIGCEALNHRVWEVKPRLHLFGHIHEGYGDARINYIHFVNASCLNLGYQYTNPPIVVDW